MKFTKLNDHIKRFATLIQNDNMYRVNSETRLNTVHMKFETIVKLGDSPYY